MAPAPKPKKSGIWKNSRHPQGGGPDDDDLLVDKVADFSYSSDALAQLVVECWLGQHTELTDTTRTAVQRAASAKGILQTKGIFLEQPIVLSEQEYTDGFSLADANLPSAVVLVVPARERATIIGTPPILLETAKMLMAVTPNGI